MSSIGKRALRLSATLILGYLIALLLLRFFGPQFVYFPDYGGRLAGDWHPRGLPVQDVWLTSHDGTRIHSWWIPAGDARFTFIAFHGNAGNITSRAYVYSFLRDIPANVFAVEYRGYGKSEGRPDEQGFYRDADAAYQYLVKTEGIDPNRVVAFGQSLGTTVAAHLAAQEKVGGLILEAPVPSAKRMVQRVFWFFPGFGLLVTKQFDTLNAVKIIDSPKLIVYCTQDPVIPPDLEQEVYEAAKPPKKLFQVEGNCHEESSLIAPAEYRVALNSFLANIDVGARQASPEH